ncbi:hypothetical protein DFH09DRAFT_1393495 [Mycena vulgaris]|nr:hypothetical protein DFH09DRAFT_1393495 [Mycena vulgaris]
MNSGLRALLRVSNRLLVAVYRRPPSPSSLTPDIDTIPAAPQTCARHHTSSARTCAAGGPCFLFSSSLPSVPTPLPRLVAHRFPTSTSVSALSSPFALLCFSYLPHAPFAPLPFLPLTYPTRAPSRPPASASIRAPLLFRHPFPVRALSLPSSALPFPLHVCFPISILPHPHRTPLASIFFPISRRSAHPFPLRPPRARPPLSAPLLAQPLPITSLHLHIPCSFRAPLHTGSVLVIPYRRFHALDPRESTPHLLPSRRSPLLSSLSLPAPPLPVRLLLLTSPLFLTLPPRRPPHSDSVLPPVVPLTFYLPHRPSCMPDTSHVDALIDAFTDDPTLLPDDPEGEYYALFLDALSANEMRARVFIKTVHRVQRIALLKRVLTEKEMEIPFNWV